MVIQMWISGWMTLKFTLRLWNPKLKQAEYIFYHLSGMAQDEIWLRPITVRADLEQVIAILRSVFGDRGQDKNNSLIEILIEGVR